MSKQNNTSKKGLISSESIPQHYKSEASKVSSINKCKQKFSIQNIKDFKYEIDHQIAKCLDTLDRQGLKFLKQTLRASKIFGLNTQELTNTFPIEENISHQSEHRQVKSRSPQKKNNSKNIVVKKVIKAEPLKKPSAVSKAARNDTKTNLGENIHKKLQSMNIKTGRKIQMNKKQQIKKEQIQIPIKIQSKSQNQIAQEIEVQQAVQQIKTKHENQQIKIDQLIKCQEAIHLKQEVKDLHQAPQILQQKFFIQQRSVAKANKPFYKKQFKNFQNIEGHKPLDQDYGLQITNEEEIRQLINQKQNQIRPQLTKQRIENQPPKLQTFFQKNFQNKSPVNQTNFSILQNEKKIQPELLTLIEKINKLSPSKRGKLQRILQKLQQNPLIQTSMLSIGLDGSKAQVSYMKPYIPQKNSIYKQSNTSEKSKSRSKLLKIEKATSIKDSIVKRNNNQVELNSPKSFDNKNSESRIQQSIQRQAPSQLFHKANFKSIQQSQENNELLKLSCKKQNYTPISLQNSINSIQKEQLISSNLIESSQKLIKIGKKKNVPTNITLKILSNKGHPSLVSLSNIILYNQSGEIILIDETNVKNFNHKLIKLFTLGNESWTTQLSNSNITIQNILQPLGGIRIINFNKSQIENNKQADLVQLFLNQQLLWRGQLKGGSFKQGEHYITDVKISSKDFNFPHLSNQITKSKLYFGQGAIKQNLIDLRQRNVKEEVDWLQKQSVYQKMKEIQESEKNQIVTKKIQSIRNTISSVPPNKLQQDNHLVLQTQNKCQPDIIISKNVSRLRPNQEKGFSIENITSPQDKPNQRVLKQSQDILGQLSKSIGLKKKNNLKQQPLVSQQICNKEQYLLRKEKQQDEQFQKILKSLQKREKQQQVIKNCEKDIQKDNKNWYNQQPIKEKKGKALVQKNFQEFMKDSLFSDIPTNKKAQVLKNNSKEPSHMIERPELSELKGNFKKKTNNLDDLIDELNDMIGNQNIDQTGEEFTIPELPQGKQLVFVILSNWGNQHFYGLNGIQIFDTNGDIIKPINITSSSISSLQLLDKLCKPQFLTSDQQMQIKLPKGKKTVLAFNFGFKVEVAAIRIWNYNGHRVHSNIGVRKCHLKLDNVWIFSGEIQQSTGSSQDAYKYCQYILFTQSNQIIKKISDNDWVNKKRNSNESERMLFKSTLQNFHRPATRNDQQNSKKQLKIIQMKKQVVKLPKRMCFEYDPPQMPQGFTLKLVLHSSWGDHFFIGLNGIQIFNEKGQNITKQNLGQINAEPSSISHLAGYQRDKRVVSNLINGKNTTTSDSDIWLTPLLSDVQKIEKGRSNFILLEYSKLIKIAGINFYNYTKTPQRGVRQVQIYLDQCLLYRGYLRKYNEQEGIIHTTVNFTKQQPLLQMMNYMGYNEDHLQQEVGLVNEGKIIKQYNSGSASQQILTRPLTGKLLN